MPINEWPVDQRPREKLLHRGAASLDDAELLAIFLGSGLPGRSAVAVARAALRDSGGLRALLELSPGELGRLAGFGVARRAALQAALELGRRYLGEPLQRADAMQSPGAVARYLMAQMRHHRHEVFVGLFLDTKNRLIACDELFHGTINAAAVYPREVLRRAMHHNAAAVVFAHNHPSGEPTPSEADRRITAQLIEVLGLVDIRVLDHVVIGDGRWVSMREHDWPGGQV
ncbi:RadC family protein [Isoalcanivorax indicus]|uniref:RadC family protein n=1 Tax=Isoalcanivorax indicus TaxID=2202653 RepID=UPI000DB9C773|nr:DNA repair protein RadC [Isoalcanivorax indicus]